MMMNARMAVVESEIKNIKKLLYGVLVAMVAQTGITFI
jgi:hypothetical protein